MYSIDHAALQAAVQENVRAALAEDLGDGDINAQLIAAEAPGRARVIARESAVISGRSWFDEVFRQLDSRVLCQWQVADGQRVEADSVLVELSGPARSLLSGERAALNFLQLLSSTATRSAQMVSLLEGTGAHVLDTRKTLPGLRLAQKYAMTCGGGASHRMGLYDGYLIKENHIAACGGIAAAVQAARAQHPERLVEVETENLVELAQAVEAGADVVMLDNFDLDTMREAVQWVNGRARIEASGGVNEDTLRAIAETGVDYISMGTLTKDVRAIDLSMRFVD